MTVLRTNFTQNVLKMGKKGLTFTGADPGFLERGFKIIKGLGFGLMILSHFS